MKPFSPPKRKLYELLSLVVFDMIFYFITQSYDAVILFSLGFIWNWSASNDLSLMFENRRYKFSMLKTVMNIQHLCLKPVTKAPSLIIKIISVLPAGIFWALVIYINESDMPWWATFVGSIIFELLQFEISFLKRHKEAP